MIIENLISVFKNKKMPQLIFFLFLEILFFSTISEVNAEVQIDDPAINSAHLLTYPNEGNDSNLNEGIYEPFYGKTVFDDTAAANSATDDPREQYDTPDPDDPTNIAKFRVKTHSETNDQIKQRLIDGDVYGQIQRYKSEGETAYVSTPNELLNALWGRKGAYKSSDAYPTFGPNASGAVAQVNITHIVLTKDIVFTYGTTVNGYQSFTNLVGLTGNYIPNRNIVIDGIDPRDPTKTKHTLDFNGAYNAARIDLNSNYFKSKFVFNNVNLQGTDYFGIGSAVNNTINKTVIYRNVKYRGSQLAASYYTDIVFTGYNDIQPSISYQTLQPVSSGASDSKGPIYDDAKPGKTTYAYGHLPSNAPAGSTATYYCQQIMESYNVTFAYNTKFDSFTPTDSSFVLGYYLSNGKPCNINVMDHAEVNASSTNQGSVMEYAYSATIQLWSGELEVHPHAVLNINAYEFQNTAPNGDTNTNNTTHNPNYTRDLINLTPQGGFNPNIKIDDYATLNGNQSGPIASAGLSNGAVGLGAGASIDVGKWGKFNIKSVNAGMTTRPVLYMANSAKVNVSQPGTFDLQGDGDYKGVRSLIQLGSSATFQFNRARMVNIQYNGVQPNTKLITMNPGQMDVQNMDVYAWNRGNTAANGTHPDAYDNVEGKDYLWQSIFNFAANYNSSGFLNIDPTASSLFPTDIEDIRTNYNTNNFQRVMFHYIPTVYVKFTSQPVDDPSDVNSYTISGNTFTDDITDPNADYVPLANAYVRLNGRVQNSVLGLDQPFLNEISSDSKWSDLSGSGIDIKSNFSAISDSSGNFIVQLPKDASTNYQKTFMASDLNDQTNTKPNENGRIQAFAFKAGNYNTASIAVNDQIPPKAQAAPLRYTVVGRTIPDPKYFIDLTSITDLDPNTNSNSFTVLTDYTFKFNSQNEVTNDAFWQTPGANKTVLVDVSDPSGNITTVSAHVTISAAPVFIEISKPKAIVKIPDNSSSWTNAQWQQWITINNPNSVKALKINDDGSTNDISSSMTNDANLHSGLNTVQYKVSTGDVAPAPTEVTEAASIELRSDTVELKLPSDASGTKSIDFGRFGSYNTGYLTPKETNTYPVNVIDDRVDKDHDWQLSINSTQFSSTSSVIPVESLDLGLLDSSTNTFSSIVQTDSIITTGQTNKNLDLMTGAGFLNSDLKLTVNRPYVDSKISSGKYNAKLTWTLIKEVP
ncbi:pectate lyase-like adhesive domain-containing protein [Xylocopilactobacillus apis]|uniref:WxL domain-containing protein n=1 Tax=Xylocopilactobacillus apis TaxID=2932183 RepID=A0AAU9CPU2_9LACO|nr:hypothetical protein [Xylocopilactobacillus apis]BDR55964.1 hypothetical protein KIMC2_05260 [Xylocopilactobacillus apis]